MSRLITKKPLDSTKLNFAKFGAKPVKKQPVQADVENAADAKKPGDAKEDAADQKAKKPVKKVKNNKKSASYFANKAATALVVSK